MIEVEVSLNKITVIGHAGYAPKGNDIVCAAVSALTQALMMGLDQIAGMRIATCEKPGNICIEWQHANDVGKALIDTWFIGICKIADSYENYIKVI